MEKCEMAGDYEILQAVRLGGKEVLLGYNPKDGCAPYMTSYAADPPGSAGGRVF